MFSAHFKAFSGNQNLQLQKPNTGTDSTVLIYFLSLCMVSDRKTESCYGALDRVCGNDLEGHEEQCCPGNNQIKGGGDHNCLIGKKKV